ncbi:MAG: DUF3501 family protein [Planctomycetota bacterium]|nr:MAG: DUF3501 family protein [Planctomycetota bacterium]
MKSVRREDIPDPEAYEKMREAFRQEIMEVKKWRRVHLGSHLTFLFETTETIRYQVLEMLRIEDQWEEPEVNRELKTHNDLLADRGDLACTLLIEIEDPLQRDILLGKWLDLPSCIYMELEDGSRITPDFDRGQAGVDRLSSVLYLKFPCGGKKPSRLGIDKDGLQLDVQLNQTQQEALAADLRI